MSRPSPREFRRWLPLGIVNAFVDIAEERGVSDVARRSGQFLDQYRKARGQKSRLSQFWRDKRNAFVARHGKQAKGESLWSNGRPSRRLIALVIWAWAPGSISNTKLKAYVREWRGQREGPMREAMPTERGTLTIEGNTSSLTGVDEGITRQHLDVVDRFANINGIEDAVFVVSVEEGRILVHDVTHLDGEDLSALAEDDRLELLSGLRWPPSGSEAKELFDVGDLETVASCPDEAGGIDDAGVESVLFEVCPESLASGLDGKRPVATLERSVESSATTFGSPGAIAEDVDPVMEDEDMDDEDVEVFGFTRFADRDRLTVDLREADAFGDVNPFEVMPEDGGRRYVVQAEHRGKEFRHQLRIAFDDESFGWTLYTQNTFEVLKSPVRDADQARGVFEAGQGLIDFSVGGDFKLVQPDNPRSRRINVLADQRGLGAIAFMERDRVGFNDIEGEDPLVVLRVGEGTVYNGWQQANAHEYFFDGSGLKGKILFRAVDEVETQVDLREATDDGHLMGSVGIDWFAIQVKDQTPGILTRNAIDKNKIGLPGVPYMPPVLAEAIPASLRFWEMSDADYDRARRRLRDIMDSTDIGKLVAETLFLDLEEQELSRMFEDALSKQGT